MSGALLSYAALTGSARHREAAVAALGVLPAIAARYPRAGGAGLAVAEAVLAGPTEIAIIGPDDDERTRVLHRTALHAAPPGAVLALGDGTADDDACRCWPAAGRSTAPRPRTSAASSPAGRRSPPRRSSGRRSPHPPRYRRYRCSRRPAWRGGS